MSKLIKRLLKFIFVGALIGFGFIGTKTLSSPPSDAWKQKVDTLVLEEAAKGETEILITLQEQADLSPAFQLNTKEEKGEFVYNTLREVALRSQRPILEYLQQRGIPHRSFWVSNMIWVKADYNTIAALAVREDIARIYLNPHIKMPSPPYSNNVLAPNATTDIEWNIDKIQAPAVWAKGFTGQGVVIGGQDTGVDWDHPALINQYRGWDGATANHNYNWHDAIHKSSGNFCGNDSPEPCDDHYHGTHTIGIAVGDDGITHHIGVAPGAQWIACRNMDEGDGTPATYTECYEWFIAPYPIDSDPFTDGDPDKAPDIINNSWACIPSEGCNPESLRSVVQAVYAAGILSVQSAGNGGPACSTVSDPAAIYPESFTVGATDSTDLIASYSSRGPVTADDSNLLKPNVSAPGTAIKSCVPGGGYMTKSGTSMAAPHVAGLAALLLSADPALSGQVDKIRQIIEQSADPQTTNEGCGGDTPTSIPNNTFGWGRVDALRVFDHHLSISKTAQPSIIAPGQLITYTLTITHYHPLTSTSGVVLTDMLPVNTEFISATNPFAMNGNTISWNADTLTSTESSTYQFIVRALQASGEITNTVYGVKSDDVPTVFGKPVTTTIIPYDIEIEKSAPSAVAPGKTIPYTLTVTNPHPSAPLHNILISDTIPTDTVFITGTLPNTLTQDMILWNKDKLDPGQTWSVTLTVSIPVTQTSGIIYNYDYGVQSDEVPFKSGKEIKTPVHMPGLMLSPGVEANLSRGSEITYTHTLTNTGNFTDTFEISIDSSQGWVSSPPIAPITLSSGQSSSFLISITVPQDASIGDIEITTITAQSQADSSVSKDIIDTTKIQAIVYFPLIFGSGIQ